MSSRFAQFAPDTVSEIFIFGAGGFGREVAWLARECYGAKATLAFIVDDSRFLSPPIHDIEVKLLEELDACHSGLFVVALGAPRDREAIASKIMRHGYRAATLIHPSVLRSESVVFGPGCIICANSVLTCDINVGAHVHINLACTVGHDVEIGDFSTLSPGVNVSGNVKIGERVFVGSNVCIINGSSTRPLIIGNDAVIAAGACVTKDVLPGSMVAGVPAILKR